MQETMITTSRATVGRQAKAFVLSFAQSIISFFRILENYIYVAISTTIGNIVDLLFDLFKGKIQNLWAKSNENNNENLHGFFETLNPTDSIMELKSSAVGQFKNEEMIAKDEVLKSEFDEQLDLENRFLIVLKLSLKQIQGLLDSTDIKFFSNWRRINYFTKNTTVFGKPDVLPKNIVDLTEITKITKWWICGNTKVH